MAIAVSKKPRQRAETDTLKSMSGSQRGFVWSALSQGGVRFISLLRGLILARLLLPEEFGVFGMVQLFVACAWVVADLGFGTYLTQLSDDQDRDHVGRDTVLTLQLIYTGALALIAVLAAPMAPLLFDEIGDLRLIYIVAAGNVGQSLMLTTMALLRKRYDHRAATIVTLTAHIANLATAILIALQRHDAYALAWGWFVLSTLGATGGVVLAMRGFSPKLDKDALAKFRTYAGGYLGQATLWFVLLNADNAIIALQLGKRELGLYSLAFSYGTMIPLAFQILVANVALPLLSSYKDDPEHMRRTYLLLGRVGAPWALAVLFVLAPLGDRILPLLLGKNWTDAGLAFALLLVAGVMRSVIPSTQVFWATGKTRTPFRIVAWLIGPTLAAAWWVAPRGITAVAAVMLVFYVCVESLHLIAASRQLSVSIRDWLAATWAAQLAGVLVAGALLYAREAVTATPMLLAALAMAAVAYVGLIGVLDRNAVRDALLLLHRQQALQERIER